MSFSYYSSSLYCCRCCSISLIVNCFPNWHYWPIIWHCIAQHIHNGFLVKWSRCFNRYLLLDLWLLNLAEMSKIEDYEPFPFILFTIIDDTSLWTYCFRLRLTERRYFYLNNYNLFCFILFVDVWLRLYVTISSFPFKMVRPVCPINYFCFVSWFLVIVLLLFVSDKVVNVVLIARKHYRTKMDERELRERGQSTLLGLYSNRATKWTKKM